MLVIGQGVRPTGFGRVMESIVSCLIEHYEFHYFAINYRGRAIERPWRVYANTVEGDTLGVVQLARLLQSIRPALVFITHDFWLYLLHKAVLDSFPDMRVVLYCPVDGRLTQPDMLLPLRELDMLVAYTHFGARELQSALGLAMADTTDNVIPRLSVIPHGVDTAIFHPLDVGNHGPLKVCTNSFDWAYLRARRLHVRRWLFPERPEIHTGFIIFNGNRHTFRKRLITTVEGFASFARGKTNVFLCLLHQITPIDHETLHIVRSLEQTGQLLTPATLGWVTDSLSDAQLNLLYNCCDVGLNTASGEGWGLISFEHAVTGAAQVVPDHSGCQELWRNRGILLPTEGVECPPVDYIEHRTVSALCVADALEYLYSCPSVLAEQSCRAFEHAWQPNYAWDTVARTWNQLFRQLIFG